ncbi:hypothetical protein CHS0354_002690 [Potamilus streckersoni]|uniref:Activin types I and II receptor domain-containing protein n=1 Tax=Potamilus streckersoni TaxID=2493646 RepID=A0AAE0VK50_9BIVA|nr:hypothetical protein CHS0354_002690 [Potamilus streckersoni]
MYVSTLKDIPTQYRIVMWSWLNTLSVCLLGCVLTATLTEGGALECICTTEECRIENRPTCTALHYCYVQRHNGEVTRGCIDDRTPLLCDNKPPLIPRDKNWPLLECCKNDDFCNSKDIKATYDTNTDKTTETKPQVEINNPYVNELTGNDKPCPDAGNAKLINPIYIAVPIAGVCVLLALIIFAMYLLRRRTEFYGNYDYHEQLAKLSKKENEAKRTTTCSGCNGALNRCTDSERSSQGSETKLFLNA